MSKNPVTTALGTFNVINYTRYCTEDIVAILNQIEASVPQVAYTNGKPSLGNYISRSQSQTETPTIILKDFTGKPVHDYVYTNGKRILGRKFILAKRRWRAPLEFRMLPPDKIYSNPMEALALATESTPVMPAEMRDEIVQRIVEGFSAFESWGPFRGQFVAPTITTDIRIFRRKAADAPKRTRKTVLIERGTNRHFEAGWRVNTAAKACDNLRLTMSSLCETAKQLGIEPSDQTHLLLSAHLEAVKAEADRLLARIKELE